MALVYVNDFILSVKNNLFETLLLCDSLINAGNFLTEYALYKVCKPRIHVSKRATVKQEVVKKCNELYKLSSFDRCLLYGCVNVCFWTMSTIIDNDTFIAIMYVGSCLIVLPPIQHALLSFGYVTNMVTSFGQHKQVFIKYSLSKLLIRTIKGMDEGIKPIKNYQILVLFNHISISQAWELCKSMSVICLLHLLRSSHSTYSYYKVVKYAYYYSTGYTFTMITKDDAVRIVNLVVEEKRWKDVTNMNVSNAFYTLAALKHTSDMNVHIFAYKFVTVWSIMSALKLLNVYMKHIVLVTQLLLSQLVAGYKNQGGKYTKDMFSGVLIYILMRANVNGLVVSFVYFGRDAVYYLCNELVFYIQHRNDIAKVLLKL